MLWLGKKVAWSPSGKVVYKLSVLEKYTAKKSKKCGMLSFFFFLPRLSGREQKGAEEESGQDRTLRGWWGISGCRSCAPQGVREGGGRVTAPLERQSCKKGHLLLLCNQCFWCLLPLLPYLLFLARRFPWRNARVADMAAVEGQEEVAAFARFSGSAGVIASAFLTGGGCCARFWRATYQRIPTWLLVWQSYLYIILTRGSTALPVSIDIGLKMNDLISAKMPISADIITCYKQIKADQDAMSLVWGCSSQQDMIVVGCY